jgi:hypothetical protein
MTAQKKLLVIFGIICIFCCLYISITIQNMKQEAISFRKTQQIMDDNVLKEVSQRTGITPTWLSLREYIFCDSLQRGMTREEVNTALSKIGEIEFGASQGYFKNHQINTTIGPVFVFFDKPEPNGRLVHWRRSYESNLGQPLASCELDQ